jgi:hypothetical protein
MDAYGIFVGNLLKKAHLDDGEADRKVTLRWVLRG